MLVKELSPLQSNWDYQHQSPSLKLRLRRLTALTRRCQFPANQVLQAPAQVDDWVVYFVYLPDGQLADHHRFAMNRIKDSGLKLLVVCATATPGAVPKALNRWVDALCWKALAGYDFSAYRVGLDTLAQHVPGSNALIMNDSMFGPFHDLRPFLQQSNWDLTGFTASSLEENHIQSYAFIFRNVRSELLVALQSVFFPTTAFSDGGATILWQETRLARIAAKHMRVGAYWYANAKQIIDPCLVMPFALVEAGFPFMKRSLLGKMSGFQANDAVLTNLERFGYPVSQL